MSHKLYNLNLIFRNLPPEINTIINLLLYENKESLQKYKDQWNLQNKKQIILMDMINIPNNMICYNYLTIKNYNEFPCWYCNGIHTLRICNLYMKDMSRVYKIYDNI
jgi:hypothetical protein